MKKTLALFFVIPLLGCSSEGDKPNPCFLDGAWMLSHYETPMGNTETFSSDRTFLRIYQGDSALFQCRFINTQSAMVIQPNDRCVVTLINKGGGENVYIEDEDPRPLTMKDDSTIVIQQNGVLYTWHRADRIYKEWGEEICSFIAADLQREDRADASSYVLSAKERQQASIIHVLLLSIMAFILISLIISWIAIDNRKAKRRLQLQLQQIQEMRDERPQSVRQAMASVEKAYFASDDYQLLQRRIATGQRLKEEEWVGIENQIKKIYPGFSSQLRSLYSMSELEYQVCLLVKLRMAPTEIALVLSRDASTISTVRSRLYKKVFGRKGGAREWDEFILSIGA